MNTMTISYRKLIKWRKEALHDKIAPKYIVNPDEGIDESFYHEEVNTLNQRILDLTQELIDQHLISRHLNKFIDS